LVLGERSPKLTGPFRYPLEIACICLTLLNVESIVQTNPNSDQLTGDASDRGLQRIIDRLVHKLDGDMLVQQTTDRLHRALGVDRVVLYYFFRKWDGQVTFESLSSKDFSILGSTGPTDCFNGDYAVMYEEGRVRAIADIETETIAPCHRDFLRDMNVRANLVVPVLTGKGLWGLLVAHHCTSPRTWNDSDIGLLKSAAITLATAPSIQDS
jgi:GAF domain-containing protein